MKKKSSSLSFNRKKRGVLELLIDGEPWKLVHRSIFGDPPELPESSSAFDALELKLARRWSLLQLGRREMSVQQLLEKLRERLVSEPCASHIVSEFVTCGYIDDDRFGKMIVSHGMRKGHGPRRIQLSLRKKGIPKALADNSLADYSEEEERKAIEELLKSRCGEGKIQDPKVLRKVYAQALRRGFTPALVMELLCNND